MYFPFECLLVFRQKHSMEIRQASVLRTEGHKQSMIYDLYKKSWPRQSSKFLKFLVIETLKIVRLGILILNLSNFFLDR